MKHAVATNLLLEFIIHFRVFETCIAEYLCLPALRRVQAGKLLVRWPPMGLPQHLPSTLLSESSSLPSAEENSVCYRPFRMDW
jgi:hypothetical protein